MMLAHAPAIGPALRGEAVPGAPLDDGDTLYSLRLADDAWAWLREVRSVTDFLWVPVHARVLNVLDLVVAVWPARALAAVVGAAPALATLHVGLVMAAAAAGALYARALGAGVAGATAGGIVAGASGMVLTVVGVGQYPQGLLLFPLLWFAGVARVWRGERGGVALAVVGGAGSLLAYWLFAPILALGTAALAVAGWTVSWAVAPRAWRAALAIGVGIAACVLPWALPVLGAAESKVASVPWGTGFHAAAYWREAAAHVVGEVTFATMLSLGGGWLPALPLLVAAALGVRKATAPWLALAIVGAGLALGPLPMVPGVGAPVAGLREAVPAMPRWMDPAVLSDAERVNNLPYQVVYQWLPGAARMRHPMRWGVLFVAGVVPLVAFGVDRLAARRGRAAWALVAAGGAWAAVVGPWPMPATPFPGEAADALSGCTEILFPNLPKQGGGNMERVTRLDGIHGRPRFPRIEDPRGGTGSFPASVRAAQAAREPLLTQVATGNVADVPDGACIVVDLPVTLNAAQVGLALGETLGKHERVAFPAHTVDPDGRAGEIQLWRVHR
ncbi:MAG: hypothetical protein Q8P41_07280 [Pseudomonadota bacterium]|nr:hypothetical protein [Pseudomonadota bacterium]